jgi:transcriptional regulator with XRE-family HTH domain
MTPLQQLGSTIRKLRLIKGLSQEQLGLAANIDRSYIAQIENGRRNIAFENTVKIARALEVSLSDLFEGIQ